MEKVLPRKEGGHHWEGGVLAKGDRRVNIVQKMCTCLCKCKNNIHFNFSRNRGRGRMKKNGRGGEFMYDIFDTLQKPL
jgi:hypothetical protein